MVFYDFAIQKAGFPRPLLKIRIHFPYRMVGVFANPLLIAGGKYRMLDIE